VWLVAWMARVELGWDSVVGLSVVDENPMLFGNRAVPPEAGGVLHVGNGPLVAAVQKRAAGKDFDSSVDLAVGHRA